MTTPQVQMLAKCKEIFRKAETLYGVDLSHCSIRFDLKGRVGGMACRRGAQMYMRFNYDMMTRELGEMLNVVAPHEIAHIVCFLKPQLGNNHNHGWASVCRALGGSGDRTHDMDVVYGKGTTYEYTTDRGHKVRLNERRHAHIQSGRSLTYRKGMGQVTKQCAYCIVGVRGRTLAEPIVKTPTPTKEAPVATFVPPAPTFYIGAPEVIKPRVIAPVAGESKAAISRKIMLVGHAAGQSYETIIAAMIAANGYSRQLARATYLANAPKVGISLN